MIALEILIACLLLLTLVAVVVVYMKMKDGQCDKLKKDRHPKTHEGYLDPVYPNEQKLITDWYPRANGSIYGAQSNVLSGFPFYSRAY